LIVCWFVGFNYNLVLIVLIVCFQGVELDTVRQQLDDLVAERDAIVTENDSLKQANGTLVQKSKGNFFFFFSVYFFSYLFRVGATT
jgi:hypothetical protein